MRVFTVTVLLAILIVECGVIVHHLPRIFFGTLNNFIYIKILKFKNDLWLKIFEITSFRLLDLQSSTGKSE